MNRSNIKVAVIMGGSSEKLKQASKEKGSDILDVLDDLSYQSIPVFVEEKMNWSIPPEELKDQADLAFICYFGGRGEGGRVHDELESVNIPFVGSDSHSSGICTNKFLSLRLLRERGFNVPVSLYFPKKEWLDSEHKVVEKIIDRIESPWVLKPNRGTLSDNIYFAKDREELQNYLFKIFKKQRDILVQEEVRGREVSCVVLDHGIDGTCYPLFPAEMIPNLSHYLNFDSKNKKEGVEIIYPANLGDMWIDKIRKTAKECHELLGCRHVSKVDMIIKDEEDIFLLEVNSNPVHAENYSGLPTEEFVDKLIKSCRSFL